MPKGVYVDSLYIFTYFHEDVTWSLNLDGLHLLPGLRGDAVSGQDGLQPVAVHGQTVKGNACTCTHIHAVSQLDREVLHYRN